MRKTHLIFSTLVLLLAGLLAFTGCTVTECGNGVCETGEANPLDPGYCPTDCLTVCDNDGTCDAGETVANCPGDCGTECGNGVCETGETTANCPADCAAGGASVSLAWYIHGIQGGVNVGWGSGEGQDVCELIQAVKEVTVPPRVQLWIENTGDNTADLYFDFPSCSAGQGATTEEWEDGDTIKYAFALADPSTNPPTLLSQSEAWETGTLTAGVNNMGTVNFNVGDYGPLWVDLTWADKLADPTYVTCEALDPFEVNVMGYLFCFPGAAGTDDCDGNPGWIYDEVDIDTAAAIACQNSLKWDIVDWGSYILILDGRDTVGTTLWGATCENLNVTKSDYPPALADQLICEVLMTDSP